MAEANRPDDTASLGSSSPVQRLPSNDYRLFSPFQPSFLPPTNSASSPFDLKPGVDDYDLHSLRATEKRPEGRTDSLPWSTMIDDPSPTTSHALWLDESQQYERRVHPGFDPLQQTGSNRFLLNSLRLSLDTDLLQQPMSRRSEVPNTANSSAPSSRRVSLETPPTTPLTSSSSTWGISAKPQSASVSPFSRRGSQVDPEISHPSPPASPITPPYEVTQNSSPSSHDFSFSPVVGSYSRRSSLPTPAQVRTQPVTENRSSSFGSTADGKSDENHRLPSAPATPANDGASVIGASETTWNWPTPSLAHQYRDPALSPLNLSELRADLPALDSATAGSSSPQSPFQNWNSHECTTRYVQVGTATVSSGSGSLDELISKAMDFSTYKDHCKVGAYGVVISFHDVRGASSLVDAIKSLLDSSRIRARCLTHEMTEELLNMNAVPHDLLSRSEGVLAVTFKGSTILRESSVLPLLSTYGSLRSFTSVESGVFLCEYNDDRCAETAKRMLDGRSQSGVVFQCTFEPTMTATSIRTEAHSPGRKSRAVVEHAASTSSVHSTQAQSISPFAASFTPQSDVGIRRELRENQQQQPAGFSRPAEGQAELPSRRGSATINCASQVILPSAAETRRASVSSSLTIDTNLSTSPTSLPPSHGIYRDEKIPRNNQINLQRIEQGLDLRTTLMLKNIPNRLKDVDVMQFIDDAVGRCYQFLYIRADWASGCNVGYGFVDFNTCQDLADFCRARVGTRWNLANSDKICVASYANIQGKAGLITHFRNSSVLDKPHEVRPKLFYGPGHPQAGQAEPFPACDDPIRRARSAANAVSVGLWPSQRPQFRVAEARPTQF